jgi:mono/diheme cytochrome c family protein
MSDQFPVDPRLQQPGASDESLLSAHEKELGKKPDDRGHYRMLPLVLLFVFSGLIFYAGTYLNHYSGQYKASIFNENAHPANANAAAAKIDPIVLGKRNYEQVCSTCHQLNGQGVAGIYPPLAGSEWVTGSADRVIRILLHGLKGPLTVEGKEYGQAAMPAFGQVAGSGYNWNDDRIAAVLTYIRQEWGNKAEPITSEQVTAVHTKEGSRKEWSQDELKALP